MWGHYVALVAAMYGYARTLAISPWGSALSSVAFALCGFQAIHSVHEPFYHALVYLPLSLFLADRYATTGRTGWLAALCWPGGLHAGPFSNSDVDGRTGLSLWHPARDFRAISLAARIRLVGGSRLGSGDRLGSTGVDEGAGGSGGVRPQPRRPGTRRSPARVPSQGVWPAVSVGLKGGPNDPFLAVASPTAAKRRSMWGTVTVILAIIGWFGHRKDRGMAPWKIVVIVSALLASLPRLWPDAYEAVTLIPWSGLVSASFSLCGAHQLRGVALLAGRGFDRNDSTKGEISVRNFAGWSRRDRSAGLRVWSPVEANRAADERDGGVTLVANSLVRARLGAGDRVAIAWQRKKLGDWCPFSCRGVGAFAILLHGPE